MPKPSRFKDIFVYDSTGELKLAALKTKTLTYKDLFEFCHICFQQPNDFRLRCGKDGPFFEQGDESNVLAASYWVFASDGRLWQSLKALRHCLDRMELLPVELVATEVRPRNPSYDTAKNNMQKQMQARVRRRDQSCRIYLEDSESYRMEDDYWSGVDSSHIVPVAEADPFAKEGFVSAFHPDERQRYDEAPPDQKGLYGVYSVQNGILLSSSVHSCFDSYALSIHPTTHIVRAFWRGTMLYDGTKVEWPNANESEGLFAPAESVLRDHFEKAVLFNVKGDGQRRGLDLEPGEDFESLPMLTASEDGQIWWSNKVAELEQMYGDDPTALKVERRNLVESDECSS
ncbi:MAG: hypothetical protein M4579_005541 [Chaenotheca gracillima]|nr:MAG: hypothetical protein M4579_005541 [Chaenotheca gracillima]